MQAGPLQGVLETVLYVRDLEAAAAFYGEVLGLPVDSRKQGLFVFFRSADDMLLLFEPSAASGSRDVPPHGASGAGHVCFRTREDELDAWRGRLRGHGVSVEHEQVWPRGGRSIYFRDPDGNSLEIATPRIWGIEERP